MKIDRMGVLVLTAHLIITLAMIAVYALFALQGKPLTTIENMLLVIVGYWFGAMGSNTIRRPADQPNPPTEEEKKGA